MENANPLRILFVEDLPTDAILAEREIRKSGLEFSSQRVDTKDAFLKALEEFRPDVIVSDYSMPEFDGMQALKLSLQRDARLPFILLTGSMNEETAVACMKAGASNYVIKEHIKRLPFAVKEALEQKKTRVAMDEADRALRESEERYRTLFESMDEGFCVVEMLNDPDGKAFDYRFLEINPGFEKHTGLQQALGKTIRQMVPNHDAHWFEIYGKVARTGKAIRFEKPATAMERYYDVYAYRIGGEGSQRVGILFNDISERNRAERLTEALFEISRAVYSTENVDELFRHIHRVLSSILQANNFSIALLTDDGKTLYFPYKSDEKDTNDRPAIGVDDPHSLTVDVLKTKSSVLLDETKLLDRYATDTSKVWGTAPKCWLGVPLMIRETVIGVMSVQDYQKSSAYSQKDLNIFESAAGQIAIAIERKRAQDALRESEHRTRTFLDSTSDMAFLKDDKFRHILANRALCKFHGKTEDEIKHKKDFDLMSEEAALRCRKTDEQTLLSNALTVNEELIGDRCFETVKFPVAIATGKVGIGGYIRDVTERRRAEEKIRLSEQHLKSYLDNAGDPIYVLEAATGRIRNCNVRACQDLGYSMDELLKLSASDIEVNLSSDKIDAIHHEAISAKVRTVEGAHKRKDGTMFPVEIRLSSMSPAQPELIIAVVRDVTERRRSEKALRMQSAALEAAANAIVITDCDGVVEWVNQAFVTLTGYTLEESVGRNPRELVKSGKHDQQFYKDLWDTILAGGTWRGQIINRRKNGSLYSEEQTITPLCDVDGKVSHFIAIKEDITERQRTEDLLAESERKFKWLFDYAPVAYHVLTPEGTIWNVNVRWCESLGYSKDEALGKSVFDFITESERSIARASFETKKKDISSIRTRNERRYVSKDGVVKTFLVGDFVTVDSQGKITSVQTTMEDITERKKIEHDLRLSEERFRSVWDNSADGMRLTNREGRIIDANASFCKLVRIPREELLGNVLSAAYQREGPDDDLRLYHQRFDASETISNLFGSATLRDGESIDLDISSSFIESAGQEKLLLSLFRDVTEKRKSEKRLEDERNLLRTIIDAIPDEIAVKDTERRFIVVNSGTVKAFIRNSADEIIGMKDEDLIPEHLVKDWSEEENTVLAGGKSSMNRVANKIDSETGAIERSLMVSKVPLKDREGKIIGLVGINRDITALKQAEEMLEKERTLLLTLIENIPDEVCLKDLRHRYLTANRAAMKALGVKSLEALIGKTDQDFAPQGLAQEHVEEEEAILESGKPLINRERIKIDPKTGQVVKCLLTTKVPVKDNTGAAIGILVVNRHITERKQMEELLRASEQKFRALFEESKDLVYFSTVGGKLLDINPAGIELLGYASKQETLSIDMANEGYADSEDKGRFDRQMAQHGFVKDYEVVLRRKDGERITVLETATAVMNNKGNVVQYRGVMRDVTKQRQLERQFLQSQ
ncbi:MAG: PAS domain S-box protein [Ignavibacteriales bacterium]|nr:PAS domain S-box protein [Ignavibacteriales bacterium]